MHAWQPSHTHDTEAYILSYLWNTSKVAKRPRSLYSISCIASLACPSPADLLPTFQAFFCCVARHMADEDEVITVSASDYRRNFSMSGYRRNFESEVVASMEIWKAMVTVLIPLVLSRVSKFITDFYEEAFWLNVTMSVLTLVVAPILLACGKAKRLVIWVMHLTVTRGYEKQLKAFLLEVHCSLKPTLFDSWGRNFKLHGFKDHSHRSTDQTTDELKIDREKFDELKKNLSRLAEAPDDHASCDAELRALGLLDGYASKLRSHTLTLEDLQVFCTLENLVVVEDVKYLDPMVALKKELKKSYSDVLASFVRDQKLGWKDQQIMRETLFFFYYFVTAGTFYNFKWGTTEMLEDQIHAQQLNARVNEMLEKVDAAPDFNMLWEARFDAFIAFEYSTLGTCCAIKVFELLCRPRRIFEFNEYPASKEYPASEYTVDHAVTEIESVSLHLDNFGENTTYRSGFGPGGDNLLFDTKAIAVQEQGLLVVRQYYTMPVEGAAYWAFYGADDLELTGLVALVKSSTSNNLIWTMSLPKEGWFSDILKKCQLQTNSNGMLQLRMDKLILAPY